jgi:hypothetical protein
MRNPNSYKNDDVDDDEYAREPFFVEEIYNG